MGRPPGYELELIPVLHTADGMRLFDHNANPGDFDNHVLDADNGWSVSDDGATCVPAEPTSWSAIEFRADWVEVQHGAIVPGGTLSIEYDLLRMPDCWHDSYMGSATWNTNAYVRFQPGGQEMSASALECQDARCDVFDSVPLEVDVPSDATEVEMWFSSAGRACGSHWDSNFGDNYRFVTESSLVDVAWASD